MGYYILAEGRWLYYLVHRWGDKEVNNFPKRISSKVKLIARLGFELTYHDATFKLVIHCTTRLSPYLNLCYYACIL